MSDEEPPFPTPNIAPRRAAPVAVALKGEGDALPKIVATGRGKIAEQILDLAFQKGVKVREDADLAELLVKLDLDTPIPTEAILAVAEILARVYQANARLASPASLLAGLPERS